MSTMRALALATLLVALPAYADGDLCAPGVKHHGAPIDLDVKAADIHDVLRLLADVGHVNLVVAEDVSGKVTLHLTKVPWDEVACAIAGVHHLTITVQNSILLVQARR
jgi:type IV pilus assembly protein PilQ